MANKKKGGLGVDVLFETPEPEAKPQPTEAKPKPTKERRTFRILTETAEALDRLKGEALLRGKRVTYSDLLQEAVALLMKERGLE